MAKHRMGGIYRRQDWEALSPSLKVEYQQLLDEIAVQREGGARVRLGKGRRRLAEKLVGSVVTQNRKGHVRVAPADRLYRRMTVITSDGPQLVELRGSRVASLVARHANAVRKFVDTGDARGLRQFRGQSAGGYQLATNPNVVRRLANRGEIDFEDIYDRTA